MMDWGNSGWGAGEWVAMSAMMIVFWVAVTALVVWAVRSNRSETPASHADTLLAERFARGEINGEEFANSRELLHAGGSSPSHSMR